MRKLTQVKSKLICLAIATGFLGLGSFNQMANAEVNQLVQNVGLTLRSNKIIRNDFYKILTEYIGECPGSSWSGNAMRRVRFLSFSSLPSKNLRVNLVNLNTYKSITKKYDKSRGSSRFRLRRLGNGSGKHSIKYKIYNNKTNSVIETGRFSYSVSSRIEDTERNGEWKLELFCVEDESTPIKDCEYVGKRERKYCQGTKTSDFRNQGLAERKIRITK